MYFVQKPGSIPEDVTTSAGATTAKVLRTPNWGAPLRHIVFADGTRLIQEMTQKVISPSK